MKTITIDGVQGVPEAITIPLQDGGGVTVLRGWNGAGKSQGLKSVRTAVTGDTLVAAEDPDDRATIEGLGVKVSLGRRTSRRGELSVDTIEGRFDLTKLIDPRIKGVDPANRARVAALAQLTGAKLDAVALKKLRPRGAKAIPVLDDISGDPIAAAEKIRKAFHAAARSDKQDAAELAGKLQQIDSELAGIAEQCDGDAIDEPQAKQLHESAVAKLAEQVTRQSEQGRSLARKAEAELALANRADDAEAMLARLAKERAALDLEVDRLKLAYDAGIVALRKASAVEGQADATVDALAGAKSAASYEIPEGERVTDDTLQTSRDVVDQRLADLLAVQSNERRNQLIEIRKIANREQAIASRRQTQWEHAADGVYGVLAKSIDCDRLDVNQRGTLVCTAEGGKHFAKLSDGQRTREACIAVAPYVAEHGVAILDQVYWDGLDSRSRSEVVQAAKSAGINIVTAEKADCDLEVTTL